MTWTEPSRNTKEETADSAAYERGDILSTRIVTAVIGIVILGAVSFFSETIVLDIVVSLASALAIHEMIECVGLNKKKFFEGICILFGVAFSTVYFNIFSAITFLAEMIFAGLVLIFVLTDKDEIKIGEAMIAFFAATIIPRAFSVILLIRDYGMPYSRMLCLLSLCVAWVNDTFAYFVGVKFGKHKLCPEVSPKKTVEGFVGGIVGNVIFISLGAWLFAKNQGVMINWASLVPFIFIGTGAAVLGDLCASVIKRQYGKKDYGNLLPGHGGILDRFDSWLFAAPLMYIWNIYMPFFS